MRRSVNKTRGNRAERRTREYLEKVGTVIDRARKWQNPDFEWFPVPGQIGYGVEVKSALSITAGEVGRIGVSRTQWGEILEYCELYHLEPLLVLEVIVRGSFRMYWSLNRKQVDERFKQTTAKMACWSIWQFLRDGRRLD